MPVTVKQLEDAVEHSRKITEALAESRDTIIHLELTGRRAIERASKLEQYLAEAKEREAGLVRTAFHEGFRAGYSAANSGAAEGPSTEVDDWLASRSRAALTRHHGES